MADIEIKTNSEQVISELQNIQSVMEETNEIISSGNAANAESFSVLGEAVENTSASYETISETATLASETFTEFGSVTEGMIEQVTLFNSVLDSMNEKLSLGITNILALNEASTANTTIMAANMAQSLLSTAALVTYNATVAQAKLTTDTYSQSIALNTANLNANYLATSLLNALLLINGSILTTHSQTVATDTASVESNSVSIGNNSIQLGLLSGVLGILSGVIMSNSSKVDENSESMNENIFLVVRRQMELNTLAQLEKIMAAVSAFNTAMTTMGNVVKLKELTLSKKAQTENKKEAVTEQAKAIAKFASLMTSPVGIIIGVACLAAIGVAIAALKALTAPAMATGGVVSKPTMALVGEGRYPEAVVPLGNSPQFASMKADIASAVLQGVAAMSGGKGNSGGNVEVVLNIDGDKFARAVMPAMEREYRRKGRSAAVIRSV